MLKHIKKKLPLLLISLALLACSILLFFYLGYNQTISYLQGGVIITTYRWIPILILSGATFFIIITSWLYLKNKVYTLDMVRIRLRFKATKLFCGKKWLKLVMFVVIPLLVALLQTHSLWNFHGEEVDESEVYQYAIGFMGGDLDPHWYGYGSLGMYLLYGVYMTLYGFHYVIGNFSTISEYAMQLFYNNYFLLLGRYIFALIGLGAIMVYARMAKELRIPIVLIILFLLLAISSPDVIFFSNFIRTDQLVMFFTAIIIYFASNSHIKRNLYFMAIAVAGAIASKISAIPFIGILGIYSLYRLYDKTIGWKHIVGIGLILIISLIVFQPYTDLWHRVYSIIQIGSSGYGVKSQKIYWQYSENYIDRIIMIYKYYMRFGMIPYLLLLPLLLFTRKYIKVVIPSVITLILLTIPYVNSLTFKYYWFLPTFNLIKFLALIGVAGFIVEIGHFINKKHILSEKNTNILLLLIPSIVVLVFLLPQNIVQYKNKFREGRSNQQLAQEYIEKNLLETESVVLDGNRYQYLPKVYDPKNIIDSRKISSNFKYNRDQNIFLVELFTLYVNRHYLQFVEIDSVRSVSQYRTQNRDLGNYKKKLMGSYFVTMPFIYGTPLRKSPDSELGQYYSYIISNPLIKKIDAGSGHSIEIYHITHTPSQVKGFE